MHQALKINAAMLAIVLAAASWPLALHAEDATRRIPKIEPQPLAKALLDFADLSGLQLAYESELANGQRSPGSTGKGNVEQSLCELLVGTGLEHRLLNPDTVAIEKRAPGAQPKPRGPPKAPGVAGVGQTTSSGQARQQADGNGKPDQPVQNSSQNERDNQEGNGDPGEEGTQPPNEAAEAEEPDAARTFAGEVVVTAQKREQQLQEVPISIQAFEGSAMQHP